MKERGCRRELGKDREGSEARKEGMEIGQTDRECIPAPGNPPGTMLNGIASHFTWQTMSFLSPMIKLLRTQIACE